MGLMFSMARIIPFFTFRRCPLLAMTRDYKWKILRDIVKSPNGGSPLREASSAAG